MKYAEVTNIIAVLIFLIVCSLKPPDATFYQCLFSHLYCTVPYIESQVSLSWAEKCVACKCKCKSNAQCMIQTLKTFI